MSTFEYIIIFFILLSVLSGVAMLITSHHDSWKSARQLVEKNFYILHCSFLSDSSSSHYVLTPARACWDYSFSINPISSSFLLVLGGDANHYG